MRPSLNSLFQSLVLVLAANSAWAGESGPSRPMTGVSLDSSVASDSLIEQGIQLRRERRDREALELFQKAYTEHDAPKALAQVALAEHALGLWLEAERHLLEALQQDDVWIEQNRRALGESLAAVRKHLGKLRVACNAPGASLTINGKPFGPVTAESIGVPAGTLQVEVNAPGYVHASRVVIVTPEQSTDVDFSFLRAATAPNEHAPGASNAPKQVLLTAVPAQVSQLPPDHRRTVAWALATGAGVLLAEAAIAHWQRERSISRYNDDSSCVYGDLTRQQRCGGYRDSASTEEVLAIIGYAAGGLAALGSVVLFASARSGVTDGPNTSHMGVSHGWHF